MTKEEYIKEISKIDKQISTLNTKKFMLRLDYHKSIKTYQINDIVGEYVIDEIGVTDDGMELVYFLYDMNENFVGYFSKEQLDQM